MKYLINVFETTKTKLDVVSVILSTVGFGIINMIVTLMMYADIILLPSIYKTVGDFKVSTKQAGFFNRGEYVKSVSS